VVDRVPRAGRDFVFDVSTYPEIMDLFLITDVLITDYSSLMFDFANTGRPMLFFTYDMADYRDNLRGFYFDFEETAPGPLLPTSDDVIEAVGDIDAVAAAHTARYQAFTTRFCPLDDGKAAARVVDRALANLK
jgi:CDP-glycerol glycerophosphotransferase